MGLQALLAERDFDLPIIFLTGHGDIPMSVQAMKRGAFDFLTKPVDEEVLLTAVRQALSRSRADHRERLEIGSEGAAAPVCPQNRAYGSVHGSSRKTYPLTHVKPMR
jgi:FixJ family two-component response regulator